MLQVRLSAVMYGISCQLEARVMAAKGSVASIRKKLMSRLHSSGSDDRRNSPVKPRITHADKSSDSAVDVCRRVLTLSRSHLMPEMRTIAIDDPGVCQSVCHASGCARTAERIDVLFGLETAGCCKGVSTCLRRGGQ